MGALAPVFPWIPEDDLLLKNAVEAGASLESLAKGAVQFSRKFTVRELQERWHSLLYDPVISAEAAFCMIELEHSASSLPSKCNRTGNSNENKCISGKRKAESVRSCYYALRKRICNEPFNSMDLSFLVAPSNSNYIGNDDEPLPGHCMLGDPVSNNFVFQESNLGIMRHTFPQIGDGGAADAFHTQFPHIVQENYAMEQDNINEEIPDILGENLSDTRNKSVVEEFSQPKELPVNGCSEFDGNQVFSSPIPECGLSFHNLEYSSPPPEMLWRSVEGVSAPGVPVDLDLREKDLQTGDMFSIPDDGDPKDACLTGFDVVQTDGNLKLEIPSDELQNATASTEDYFLEKLSNSLLDFTDDEELFLDVDGKDVIDKSYYDGLSSLLLSSPNDVNQDDVPSITEPESSVALDYLTNQSCVCPVELHEDRGSQYRVNAVYDSEVQFLSSASSSNSQFPELRDGVICCILNTEDPEIPYNDDVVFRKQLHPKSVSSAASRNFQNSGKPNSSSVKELPSNPKTSEGGPVLMHRDLENPGQSHTSHMIRSQVMPELYPVGDRGAKFEFPSNNSTDGSAGFAYGASTQINSANVSVETLVSAKLKEETMETALVKHLSHNSADFVIDKPALGSDGYPQGDANGIKQELDAPARIQNHQASNTKVGSIDITTSEQVVNHSISDPEELPMESDDDVPYFSDIEAMILDMDLDPEDQDICSSEEVSRYQHDDTKKAIMRLEQGANSYMQRSIASHGAFAVIYGRHSKHYIKKPEVLLGRATEDVIVDIDLGREGRANKISRRQATINLDKSGSFHVKNLGKYSISVNDKEIAPGRSLNLTSSCLIEIRGMPFIFETNHTCVKQYLDSIT